jgi:hypothetical protein
VYKNFLFSNSSIPALGSIQPPTKLETGVLSPGLKRSEREADHSTPTSAKVKKIRIDTSNAPYVFMA